MLRNLEKCYYDFSISKTENLGHQHGFELRDLEERRTSNGDGFDESRTDLSEQSGKDGEEKDDSETEYD